MASNSLFRTKMTEAVESKRLKIDDAPVATSSNPFASLVATPVAAKRAPADGFSPATAVKPSRDDLKWQPVITLPSPTPRESAAMVVLNGHAIAFGGTTKSLSGFPSATADLIMFDPSAASSSWRQLQFTGAGPCARAGHAMCIQNGSIIMYISFHPPLEHRCAAATPHPLAGTAASIQMSAISPTCGSSL